MEIDNFLRKIPDKITVILTDEEKAFFERHPRIKYSSFVRNAIDRAIADARENEK